NAALNLERKDLRMMERLVQAQDKRRNKTVKNSGHIHLVRTKQNRRIATITNFPIHTDSGDTIPYDRRKSLDRRNSSCNDYITQAAI
ncbi:MAG: hypothetical protein PVJ39_13125, partial [Gammaproteobacteria bacterium]